MIEAGNIPKQSINHEKYLNTFKLQSLNINLDKSQTGNKFKFGDIVFICKLDRRGRRNLIFAEAQISSIKKGVFSQVLRKSDYANLLNYEHYFQILPSNPDYLGKPVEFD